MKKIIDYIFYRIYLSYDKRHYPPTFSGICYLSLCFFFLLLPIANVFFEAMRDKNGDINKIYFYIYFILIYLLLSIRYARKDMIEKLHGSFLSSRLNLMIPTWCFFLILPILAVIEIAGLVLVADYIVAPYNLRGIGYNYIIGHFCN